MANSEHYAMLVLGSGEGGKYLAWHMARSGHRTAVIERKLIGGSCPNTNCLPSKNEIWSAKVADLVHHADRFGMVTGPVSVDMPKVLARKRDMVNGLIEMHLDMFRKSGAELIMGSGRLVAPKTIEVTLNEGGTRVLTADRVVLNLGTHPTIPDIPGLAAAAPLTNTETLELDRVPNHLIVLGGGYVGLELGQAYRRFGSTVTILEPGRQLASREDPDTSAAILEMLRDEGLSSISGPGCSACEADPAKASRLSWPHRLESRRSRPATSWSRRAARPTPRGSGSMSPESRWMSVDTSRSTIGSKRASPMFGPSGNVRAAHNSPMCRSTISGSSAGTWPAATSVRATGWSLTACTPIHRSLGWA